MNIALIGYGKMGREIERIAIERGHSIVCRIDISNPQDIDSDSFKKADVAIEFTNPDSAFGNYMKCFSKGIPVVSGTTGWLEHMNEVKDACSKGWTFFYSSNFSLGVNIFFAINKKLAEIMNEFPSYNVSMKEIHHTQKKDSPSGTAITLANDIIEQLDRKSLWVNCPEQNNDELSIISERIGQVPGYHEVKWDSEADTISISHNAKSRAGFALGAVLAAEFTQSRKGFLQMSDMLGF